MNILITSIGCKHNLIKYFRRALFNEGGGCLFGIDTDASVNTRYFVDEFCVAPRVDDEMFNQWLKDFVREHDIQLVIPSRDGDLVQLARLQNELRKVFSCHIMVSEKKIIELCLDKHNFYQWCACNGYATAKVYTIEEVKEESLPLVVKPRFGSGSKGVVKVSSWLQWLSMLSGLTSDYVIQAFIHDQEYSVDIFLSHAGKVVSVVPRARLQVANGESIHSKVVLDDRIINTAKDIVCDLGVRGHVTLQVFADEKHVLISEINARFGGGFTLAVEAGADSPRYIIQERQGKKITHDESTLIDGLAFVRIQKDIFVGRTGNRIYCFDLDGTICTESCSYEDAKPIQSVVEKVNALYESGNEILIATARGAASGKDWTPLIKEQLFRWGVMYTRLVTGKPYADYYVDNKSVDILELI